MADRVAHVVCLASRAAVRCRARSRRRPACPRTIRWPSARTSPTPDLSPTTIIVQLYVHENYTSILQPVKLEAFHRMTLAPGQSKTVAFTLVK